MNEYERRYIKRRNFVLKTLGVLAMLGVIVIVLFKAPSVERYSGSYDGIRVSLDGSTSAAKVEFDVKYKQYLFDKRDYLKGDLTATTDFEDDKPPVFTADNNSVDRIPMDWANANLASVSITGWYEESSHYGFAWAFFNKDFTFMAALMQPDKKSEGMLYVSHADAMTDDEASRLFDELVDLWHSNLGGFANPYR